MRSKLWNLLTAAVLVAASAAVARAHDWVDTSKPEAESHLEHGVPSSEESQQGFSAVYRMTVTQGQKVILLIKDTQPDEMPCTAEIRVVGTDGDAAKVKASLLPQLVRNQSVKIQGRKVGTTVATITVRGKDTVLGTDGGCTEDTKNKLIVTVVASAAQATKEYGSRWRARSLQLRGEFRTSTKTAGSEIRSHLNALGSGDVDAETAAMAIYESAHSALVRNQDAIGNALGNFRLDGLDILSEGGFNAACEPPGFGAGAGGPWDVALRDTYLQGFKALQGVDHTMIGARRTFDRLRATGKVNAQMTYQPGYFEIPAYAPPSANPIPGTKSRNDLQIQLYGGISFQNAMDEIEGCLWFGGRYDPTKGAPVATLYDPFGGTIEKTATANSSAGSWSVRYDDLTPGLTYRVNLAYETAPESTSCVLSTPWIDPK